MYNFWLSYGFGFVSGIVVTLIVIMIALYLDHNERIRFLKEK